MTYICIGLAWLNGFLTNFPTTWISTDFPKCQAYINWPNQSDGEAFGIYFFMITEQIPLLVFIICYWHILLVIRKSGKMFNNHDKKHSHRWNIEPRQAQQRWTVDHQDDGHHHGVVRRLLDSQQRLLPHGKHQLLSRVWNHNQRLVWNIIPRIPHHLHPSFHLWN